MAKVDVHTIPDEKLDRDIASILRLFEHLDLSAQGQALLRNMLTKSEWLMVSRRIAIAKRLLRHQSYREISIALRVGRSTIEHVDRWLDEELKDVRKALREKRQRVRGEPAMPYTLRWLRQKYPWQFLLFNLLLGDPRKE